MKLKSKIVLASVFAAIAATGSVRADSVSVSDQALTITLTTKAQAPGTFEVDPDTGKLTTTPALESQVDTLDKDGNVVKSVSTTATKAVTAKYGNKELLESIKDDLLDGTISGWSIVVSAEDGSVMAVKKDQDNVPLDISGETPDIEFVTSVDTTINKYDSEGTLTSSVNTKTEKGSVEGIYSFTVLGSEAVGSIVLPYTGMAYYPDTSDKSSQELAIIPGAGKITGIIGEAELTDANDNAVNAIIGGMVTMAAAKGTLVKD